MKVKLLEHEGAMKDSFFRPKKGTALVGIEGAEACSFRPTVETKGAAARIITK